MDIKYTKHFLKKIEGLFAESNYDLRYERGSFKTGYCILVDKKVAVVNDFYTTEGKINSIIEIMKTIPLNTNRLSEKNKQLYYELTRKSI
ncbi:MAG: hypothetical protein FVQ77_13515 [Cytophagales bacterium]|nr:hypothetical protein [Cytophagales bacterium]